LFEELLREINAVDRPDLRDGYLSSLAASLREHRLAEQARQVIRAIQSPDVRCETAVDPEQQLEVDAAFVREALGGLAEINNAEDREAAEDLVARALAATGQKAEALQLIAAANDEFRRCWRELRVAEGFVENGDFSAARMHQQSRG
jgi:hypothetical protein